MLGGTVLTIKRLYIMVWSIHIISAHSYAFIIKSPYVFVYFVPFCINTFMHLFMHVLFIRRGLEKRLKLKAHK